jgi:hypothetical protein
MKGNIMPADIRKNSPPDNTQIFAALCSARATLCLAGELGLLEAVDFLQEWAVKNGLVSAMGQDAVQQQMADAFYAVRQELRP